MLLCYAFTSSEDSVPLYALTDRWQAVQSLPSPSQDESLPAHAPRDALCRSSHIQEGCHRLINLARACKEVCLAINPKEQAKGMGHDVRKVEHLHGRYSPVIG